MLKRGLVPGVFRLFRVIDSVATTENLHAEPNANVLGDWMYFIYLFILETESWGAFYSKNILV